MDEPYASRLEHALRFGDFASAEASLRTLDAAYREYLGSGDRAGVRFVRSMALKGKSRARLIAVNPRVAEAKRREKHEISEWFRIWLQTPDLFFDWLELRKQSEDFRRKFPAARGAESRESPA